MVHLSKGQILSRVNWKQDYYYSALHSDSMGWVLWVWLSHSTTVLRLKVHTSLHQAFPGHTLLHLLPSPSFTVLFPGTSSQVCVRKAAWRGFRTICSVSHPPCWAKMLLVQASQLEFDSQNPCKKPDAVGYCQMPHGHYLKAHTQET